MTLYTDINQALVRAKERGNAKAADEVYLTELLQMSVGVHRETGETVHRPFYVAAKYLEQSRRDQTLKEADGAKFTGQAVPIASLLDQQFALDADLIVPWQYQIHGNNRGTIPSAGQLKAGYDAAILTMQRFQPRGFY
jgi:hypothetical protein